MCSLISLPASTLVLVAVPAIADRIFPFSRFVRAFVRSRDDYLLFLLPAHPEISPLPPLPPLVLIFCVPKGRYVSAAAFLPFVGLRLHAMEGRKEGRREQISVKEQPREELGARRKRNEQPGAQERMTYVLALILLRRRSIFGAFSFYVVRNHLFNGAMGIYLSAAAKIDDERRIRPTVGSMERRSRPERQEICWEFFCMHQPPHVSVVTDDVVELAGRATNPPSWDTSIAVCERGRVASLQRHRTHQGPRRNRVTIPFIQIPVKGKSPAVFTYLCHCSEACSLSQVNLPKGSTWLK